MGFLFRQPVVLYSTLLVGAVCQSVASFRQISLGEKYFCRGFVLFDFVLHPAC